MTEVFPEKCVKPVRKAAKNCSSPKAGYVRAC